MIVTYLDETKSTGGPSAERDRYTVLDDLNVKNVCCRRMFLSYDPTLDSLMLKYPTPPDRIQRLA
jgi:DNA-directed RNA polymerase subunit N (RpoN/RPB10)